jgi:hypothetical protein
MSQAGYTPIQLYYSTTAAAVPVNTNLADGELAINITDGKLYYKNAGGTVTLLASSAGSLGDVVGPASATDNALARFDTTTGKLIQNSVGILSDAGILTGLTGLTSSGSITLSSLTSGRVPYASTGGLLTDSANLTFNGTTLTVNTLSLTNALATTSGGTGLTSFTSGGVVYASSTSALATGSALTFNGTTALTITGAGSDSNGGGPAFGISSSTTADQYYMRLNASKQLTFYGYDQSNSAFGWVSLGLADGAKWAFYAAGSEGMRLTSTGLGIGTSSPAYKLDVKGNIRSGLASTTTGEIAFFSASNDSQMGLINNATEFKIYSTYASTAGYKPINFYTSDALKMTLDTSGNLGIGTSSPTAVLQVAGTQGTIRVTSTTGTNSVYMQPVNTGGSLNIGIDNSAGSSLFGASAYAAGVIHTGNYPLYLGTNNAIRFVIGASGQFGIGSSPSYGTSGQVLTSGGSGAAPTWTTVSGGGSVAGSDTQIQYNNSGAFGASSLFTFNKSTTAPMVEIGGASGVTSTSFRLRAPSATNGPYVGFSLANADAAVFWTWDTIGAIPLRFVAGGSELARFSTGGNLLINTTSDNGNKLQVNGGINLVNASNGISCHNYTTVTNGAIAFYNAYNNSDPRITFWGGTGSNLTYHTANLALYPGTDGGLTLGLSSNRWGQIYSTSGSINTSDAREKEQVEALTEAELRVAKKLKTLIRKFKWIDAVQKKGDSARIHVGVMAQDVQVAFEEEGLDASRYGLFCYDAVWVKIEEKEDLKTGGKVISKNPCLETDEGAICETRYGIRYDELLAFIIAAL